MEGKASSLELEKLRYQLKTLIAQMDSKSSLRDFKAHVEWSQASLQELQKQLVMKANMKEVLHLSEKKPPVEMSIDHSDEITELHRLISEKASG